MSQHDFDITTADANTGVTFRAAVNAALQALASSSSGATAPTNAYPFQFFADSASDTLKMRNSTNTAWIDVCVISTGRPSYVPSSVSSTEIGYLDGVTSAIQTQINSKQATLVSGTNIKTINGSDLLGPGNLNMETGFRNRIINGGMVIDQRNAGASVTPTTAQYTLDRWQFYVTQTSKASVQQVSVSTVGFTKALKVTSLSAYSITSTDRFQLTQPIEGLNIADLGWGTASAKSVTLSFVVNSSLTGTFGGCINNGSANRSYVFSYSVPVANTDTIIQLTIPGDTTGTWATDNTQGLFLSFGLGVGSTFSTTAGAWNAGTYLSATGATSVVGTNGATFYITGVQLEKGSTATPFEFRPYGTELALVQRYYEIGQARWRAYDTNATTIWMNYFKTTKRATPTMTGSASPGASALDTSAFSLQLSGSGTVDTGTVSWTALAEL